MHPRTLLGAFALCLLALSISAYALTNSLDQVFAQLEQMYQLPSGVLAKIANVENGGKSTGCAPTSTACGMFQWTQGSWYSATRALYGRSLDLSQRNNPVESAKVTAFALKQAQDQYGALIQQAKLDPTLGLYMCHFLGTGGCGTFFRAFISNPNQSAGAIFPKAAAANGSVFAGRSLAGVANFFAQRLRVAGTSVNVAGNFSDSMGISYAYSNADIPAGSFLPAGFVPPPIDPYYDYQTVYQPAQAGSPIAPPSLQPAMVPPSLFNSSLSPANTVQPFPSANTGSGTTGATSTTAGQSTPLLQPSGLIIVQPMTLSRGQSLVVSWTSVGMDDSRLCTVDENALQLAQGNSGSTILRTDASTQSQLTFSLQCTSRGGAQLQQTVPVIMH